MRNEQKRWPVVVIGGGQSGLAAGYFLKQTNTEFIILDENNEVGASWMKRWDSLHLFTPSQYDGLPGMKFPLQRNSFPNKNEMAFYLSDYARKFSLPIQSKIKTTKISRVDGFFVIQTDKETYHADKVVVATGTHPAPKTPHFTDELSTDIFQIHSSDYKNPEMIPEGDVLVVGAGTSGVEIAIEMSEHKKTYISGTPNFHIPDNVFKYAGRFYWWFTNHVLTIKTPIGRKAKEKILKGGGPLISVSVKDLDKAGVKRLPRVKGVKDGLPVLQDDTILPVNTVIWCTGFKPDFSWIDLDILDKNGWPLTNRGISIKQKGLYFVGIPFQYGLASGFVGGVGRDAEFVVRNLLKQSDI
jgi:putative flavoprotein involved in K+ transport